MGTVPAATPPSQNTSFHVALPTLLPSSCMSPLCQEALFNQIHPYHAQVPSLPASSFKLILAYSGCGSAPHQRTQLRPQADFISSLGHGQKWGWDWTVESSWGCTEGSKVPESKLWQPALQEGAGHLPEENTEALSRNGGAAWSRRRQLSQCSGNSSAIRSFQIVPWGNRTQPWAPRICLAVGQPGVPPPTPIKGTEWGWG